MPLQYLRFFWITCLSLTTLTSLWAHNTAGSRLAFVPNIGQWSGDFKFKMQHGQGAIYLTPAKIVHHFCDLRFLAEWHAGEFGDSSENQVVKNHAVFVHFLKGSKNTVIAGEKIRDEYHNYYLGADSTMHRSAVPLYEAVRYKDIWPGIDMWMHTSGENLKYQFELHPGADPQQIALQYEGHTSMEIKDGQLVVRTTLGHIIEEAPEVWQTDAHGQRILVRSKFNISGDTLRFDLPNGHDSALPLTIDPLMIFSTYSGATSDNFGFTATFDSRGYLYSGSISFATGYPVSAGAYQTFFRGGCTNGGFPGTDIAITKYDTNGSRRMYSTYLGGTCDEIPHSLVVNSRDELYVFGTTSSTNFPTTGSAYQRFLRSPNTANGVQIFSMGVNMSNGTDMFITAFNDAGTSLLASTYLGGSNNDGLNNYDFGATPSRITKYNYADEARGEIDIDREDNIYIASTTRSTDFPMVGSTIQTTYAGGFQDGVVVKMDRFLNRIIWSSYLGGFGHDAIYSLAIDNNKNIYVAGGTNSNNFRSGSYNSFTLYQGGRTDGFITHIDSNGMSVLNSTFYGSDRYDQIYFVELDRLQNVYVFGQTEDISGKFIRNATYNHPRSGQFVSKLTPGLDTTIWSTTWGTSAPTSGPVRPNISPTAFLVDVCNAVYMSGWGGATNFAGTTNNAGNTTGLDTTADAFQKTTDGSDFYVMAMADDASRLIYGSFIGGSADEHVDGGTSRFDKKGKIYQSVCAACRNTTVQFPTTSGVVARTSGFPSGCNNAVFKMDFNLPIVVAEFQTQRIYCTGDSIRFDNLSKKQQHTRFIWYFGNGDSSTAENPVYVYDSIGNYRIMLVVSDTSTCNLADTAIKFIDILGPASSVLPPDSICLGDTIQLGFLHNPNFIFRWLPGSRMVDSTVMQPYAFPNKPTQFTQLVQTDVCVDTYRVFIHVDSIINARFSHPDTICAPDTIFLQNQSTVLSGTSWQWRFPGSSTSGDFNTFYIPMSKGRIEIVLQLADAAACLPNDFDTARITVLQDSSFVLPELLVCHATPVVLGPAAQSGFNYSWNTSQGISDSTIANPIALPATDTTYMLRIKMPYCKDSAFQKVFRDSLLLSLPSDTDVCSNVGVIQLLANSGGTAGTFWWSSQRNFTDTLNSFPLDSSISFSPAAQFLNMYYVRLSSRKGCRLEDSVAVRVNEFAIYTDTAERICLGDSIWIRVRSRVPNDRLEAVWSPTNYMLTKYDSTDVLLRPEKPGLYRVETENSIKCRSRDSVSVFVSQFDSTLARIEVQEDTLLKGNRTVIELFPKGYGYQITPAENLSDPYADVSFVAPSATTLYDVEIYDPQMPDCRVKRARRIVVIELNCADPDIYVPNTFTPNNDGANEFMLVRGRYISELKFIIYDRWGAEVFRTEQQQTGWDGNYKGAPASTDVYMYYLYVKCADGQEYETKGDITIMR
jgi:gliding motility-associated-like protein